MFTITYIRGSLNRNCRPQIRVAVTNQPFLCAAGFGRGCVGNAIDGWDTEACLGGFFFRRIGLTCRSFTPFHFFLLVILSDEHRRMASTLIK